MGILKNKDRVKALLEACPTTRDHDETLYYEFLRSIGRDPNIMTAFQLLAQMKSGKLPSWETIGRCRRKIQEENKHLRGKNWKKKQEEVRNVQIELGYNV